MCGIVSIFTLNDSFYVDKDQFNLLAKSIVRRGSDSSGVFSSSKNLNSIEVINKPITNLIGELNNSKNISILAGHSRLKTNSEYAYQPFKGEDLTILHNGIILNYIQLWKDLGLTSKYGLFDTPIIAAFVNAKLKNGISFDEACNQFLDKVEGTVSAIVISLKLGKIALISNCKSLYYSPLNNNDQVISVASERYILEKNLKVNALQVNGCITFDVDKSHSNIEIIDHNKKKSTSKLLVELSSNHGLSKILECQPVKLKRCTKCILPSTMPFIDFDSNGVCNYCTTYKKRISKDNLKSLSNLISNYRKSDNSPDCIVPFSGGRDSSYALHILVNELGLRPITYTYDWGMITDLGRRNISLMCSKMNVENIIVAANISRKRSFIRKNLSAWLKKPHLGMISLLTSGDKHFFRFIEDIKKETGISLNIWGINPLEITHFKSGFLGIEPTFVSKTVYNNGLVSQLRYQYKRFKQIIKNPYYLNSSIPDTLYGEYWRSVHKKSDYYSLFDFYPWVEKDVEAVLNEYNWERAPDTKSSWRIGDGTAAFYNYVYYLVAGFTEHDTFRSNQIREGQITRDEALKIVAIENQPRFPNIKWYLDSLDIDFKDAITRVNKIPRLY
tara:strand:+ start:1090 stop:2934 length:1845 start_codon:yes stop_codon:yes gene_type:complete